jgi:hypothetical protein
MRLIKNNHVPEKKPKGFGIQYTHVQKANPTAQQRLIEYAEDVTEQSFVDDSVDEPNNMQISPQENLNQQIQDRERSVGIVGRMESNINNNHTHEIHGGQIEASLIDANRYNNQPQMRQARRHMISG